MKKLLIILSFLFASIGLKAQDLPAIPRVITGQLAGDSLGALRNGAKADSLKLWSGLVFTDGTYQGTAMDTNNIATKDYVDRYLDSTIDTSNVYATKFYVQHYADSASRQLIDSITANDTITNEHFSKLLIHNLTVNDTITIPTGLTVDDFSYIDFEIYNTGDVYIRAATGVTLNGTDAGTALLSIRYTGAFIRKIGTNKYVILGVYE